MMVLKCPTRSLLLGLGVCFALSSCSNTQPVVDAKDTNPVKAPIQTTCPAYDPDKSMCTMQYDPVCVKEQSPDGEINYRTAGNACMACAQPTAIEYVAGECS